MEAVSDFLCQVWAGGPEVVPFDLGLAVLHVGAYCAAAYDGEQLDFVAYFRINKSCIPMSLGHFSLAQAMN
jgi:hypothetical protein